jgi:hypothetical protein
LKGRNRLGRRVNGSVGKSFAYGAQRGWAGACWRANSTA